VAGVIPDKAAHSVTQVLVHVVWSTFRRWRAIDEALDDPLRRSLSNTAWKLHATLHAFGAAPDQGTSASPAFVQRLKGASSHEFRRDLVLGWQAGYWAESVSAGAIDRVTGYLRVQRAHHATGQPDEPGDIMGP
jgi:hypothetical protein